jgi:hypothetical protein
MADLSQVDRDSLKLLLHSHVREACEVMKELYSRHCQETGKVDIHVFERDHPELFDPGNRGAILRQLSGQTIDHGPVYDAIAATIGPPSEPDE